MALKRGHSSSSAVDADCSPVVEGVLLDGLDGEGAVVEAVSIEFTPKSEKRQLIHSIVMDTIGDDPANHTRVSVYGH